MLTIVTELFSLLSRKQKLSLLKLQILVVVMAFAEVSSVIAIGPFMSLISDMSQLEGEGFIAEAYLISGINSPQLFAIWMGIFVLLILGLASVISMLTTWKMAMFSSKTGAELGNRLFDYYIHQNWLFHSSGNSSRLTSRIAQDCDRLTTHMLNPLLHMNAKIVLSLFLFLALLIINPLIAIIGILLFVLAYYVLYKAVRSILLQNGRIIADNQRTRFKLLAEGFGGVKDVLLLGRQSIFNKRFSDKSIAYASSVGKNLALNQAPRYLMEFVAFGAIISLVLYILATNQENVNTILPMLSVYALAGLKMLPAFQQIYGSLSLMKGGVGSYEVLKDDLSASSNYEQNLNNNIHEKQEENRLKPVESICLRNISFTYSGKDRFALNKINLEIPVNKVIGIVGHSGSGKSTAIDILLGLVEPDSGKILIDGVTLSKENMRAWQNTIGFVPQSIFLSDSSIKHNIAFGLSDEDIDISKINKAVDMAHLSQLVSELPNGIDTLVGERGVQLSGGQRQRIGIARALYHDAEVLVLDEATSALDGITEKLIMDAIDDFSGQKTIIMIAHRIATVKRCDCIYLMDSGGVIEKGTYEELIIKNNTFKRMAKHI